MSNRSAAGFVCLIRAIESTARATAALFICLHSQPSVDKTATARCRSGGPDMTVRSADQFDVIRHRRNEIALERRKADAGEECKCAAASDDDGPFIDSSACDLHRRPAPPAGSAPAAFVTPSWRECAASVRRLLAEDETLRDRLAELGLIAGERR